MTRQQFIEKYEELIQLQVTELEREGERLLESGMIEKEDFEDDFVLPRIVLSVANENVTSRNLAVLTHNSHWQKALRNLRKA